MHKDRAKVSEKPWFALREHLDQLRERLLSTQRDAEYLLAVYSRLPSWRRTSPAYEMIDRAISEILEFAKQSYFDVQGLRDLCVDPSKSSEKSNLSNIVKCEHEIAKAEQRLSAYKEVISQRASMHDSWDWFSSGDFSDELTELQGLYSAIDAVLLGFVDDIYGRKWIVDQEEKRRPWLPVAVIGQAYSINLSTNVAFVPRAELLRARLLASLAHELAHLKVRDLFSEGGWLWPRGWDPATNSLPQSELEQTLSENLHELLLLDLPFNLSEFTELADSIEDFARLIIDIHAQIVQAPYSELKKTNWWYSHFVEFLCDGISVYTAGPAALLAYLTMHYPVSATTDFDIQRIGARSRHPPRTVRIQLMATLLRNAGFSSVLDECGIEAYLEFAVGSASDEWRECLNAWQERIPTLARSIESLAAKTFRRGFQRYNDAMYDRLYSILDGSQSDSDHPLPPRDVVNLVWLKRTRIADVLVSQLAETDNPQEAAQRIMQEPLPRLFGAIVQELNRFARVRWDEIREAVRGDV